MTNINTITSTHIALGLCGCVTSARCNTRLIKYGITHYGRCCYTKIIHTRVVWYMSALTNMVWSVLFCSYHRELAVSIFFHLFINEQHITMYLYLHFIFWNVNKLVLVIAYLFAGSSHTSLCILSLDNPVLQKNNTPIQLLCSTFSKVNITILWQAYICTETY